MTLGHRVAVMKDGLVQQYDDPQTIYQHPANLFVAGFIGSPPMNFLKARLAEEDGKFYVQGQGFKLLIPADKVTDQLKSFVGREVIFGIRPEDLRTPEMVREERPEVSFPGKVRVREALGDELIVYANCAGEEVVAKLDPRLRIDPGQEITLVADMDRMHLFDPETEAAIV